MAIFHSWSDFLFFLVLAGVGYAVVAWVLERVKRARQGTAAPPTDVRPPPMEPPGDSQGAAPEPSARGDSVRCFNQDCRQPNPRGARFCSRCGYPL
jgi:hypothetical protein